ncbi:hypothetical protein SDC9_45292 [bioreactor metagenome]|uniref:Uncharacterized protein n=1 Tax=bioreactor metagenome TaxID=1076179 RepID=A0A644W674_9ZZZZ
MDQQSTNAYITPGNINGILNRGGINVELDEKLMDRDDHQHVNKASHPGKVSTSTINNSFMSGGILRKEEKKR